MSCSHPLRSHAFLKWKNGWRTALHSLPIGAQAPVWLLSFPWQQQSLLCQRLKIDIIRVPRKSGKTLIRAVSIAGRSQRKDLPITLARCGQKIHKTIGFPPESADPVIRRKAGYGQQHTGPAAQGFCFSQSKHHSFFISRLYQAFFVAFPSIIILPRRFAVKPIYSGIDARQPRIIP